MTTHRRDFIQQVMTTGALASGAGLLAACASTSSLHGSQPVAGPQSSNALPATVKPPTPPSAALPSWDMSWAAKLRKYRTAYDSPEIYSGVALAYANSATQGYKDAFGSSDDFTAVLILRHAASVMTLNDAMWDRMELGKSRSVKDPSTGEPARRNPFLSYTKGDKFSMVSDASSLSALMSQGAVVMACNYALRGVSSQLRQKEPGLSPEQALAEVHRSVIKGVYIMPNGVFAVAAAQDAGCNYMRVLV